MLWERERGCSAVRESSLDVGSEGEGLGHPRSAQLAVVTEEYAAVASAASSGSQLGVRSRYRKVPTESDVSGCGRRSRLEVVESFGCCRCDRGETNGPFRYSRGAVGVPADDSGLPVGASGLSVGWQWMRPANQRITGVGERCTVH